MPVLSVIGLFFGNAGKAVLSWLSHASLWQLVSLGLGILLIVQHFQLTDARHDRGGYQKQRDYYHSELQRITSARGTQRKTSERTVTQVVQGQDRVRTIVKTIHDAPNPPDCRTPALPQAARDML